MYRFVAIMILSSLSVYCQDAQPHNFSLHDSQTASVDSAVGVIEGFVIDKECGEGVPFANIVVMGTRWGAMSDSTGHFCVENIPAGTYTIKVMAIWYLAAEKESIQVVSSHSTRIDFALNGHWSQEVTSKPGSNVSVCEKHNIPMENVLVPIGYGLRVSDSESEEYERTRKEKFPNAEPWSDGGCVLGIPKGWEPRCRQCLIARNRYIGGTYPLDNDVQMPASWVSYSIGAVSFSVPEVPTFNVDTSGCVRMDLVNSGSLSIQTYYGPPIPILRRFTDGWENERGQIISHVYAVISMTCAGGCSTAVAKFRVVPAGGSIFVICVATKDDANLNEALTIIRSVRFRK